MAVLDLVQAVQFSSQCGKGFFEITRAHAGGSRGRRIGPVFYVRNARTRLFGSDELIEGHCEALHVDECPCGGIQRLACPCLILIT